MRKVVLIGIDGFDPALAEFLLLDGQLPGFSELKKRGGFSRLQTTNPAQSPTAWSTIATGCNPGVHGLFDFISRAPGTYIPKISVHRPNPRNYFGRRASAYLPIRGGEAFWTLSSSQKIPTTVIKWPVSFPPEPLRGNMLSGLGVPDIRGTAGRYTYYSTAHLDGIEKSRGDVIFLPSRAPRIETVLIGPDGVTVPMVLRMQSREEMTVEVQDQSYPLKILNWSGWIPVSFHRFGFPAMKGIFRLYLDCIEPDLRLYAGAIHMDPRESPFPISAPETYAVDLAQALGGFHTLGLPEETNGLVDGLISEEAFLQHADDLLKEREAMLDHGLAQFREGIFAFVFDTLDRIQHAMWSGLSGAEAQEPAAVRRMAVVKDHYCKLDRIIQRLLSGLAEDDFLMVVSDHGFSTFGVALHVNSWLRDQGLLVLKDGAEGLPLFQTVDWTKTSAYAMGFSSLYLNRQGREPAGIVSPHDADALLQKLAKTLLDWTDPFSGEKVLHAVYDRRAIYRGPKTSLSPDLVLAPKAGFRVSWQTGYGATPRECLEKNHRAWRADHIVDPSLVPGVLFANRPLRLNQPTAADIAPTLLSAADVPPPQFMEGESLFAAGKETA